jgi:hypothetical protein
MKTLSNFNAFELVNSNNVEGGTTATLPTTSRSGSSYFSSKLGKCLVLSPQIFKITLPEPTINIASVPPQTVNSTLQTNTKKTL